jgi:hypothetical protein
MEAWFVAQMVAICCLQAQCYLHLRYKSSVQQDPQSNMAIEDKDVIDLISGDIDSPCARLIMLEHRKWEQTAERVKQLEEKIASYYNYAASGQIALDHPSLANLPVIIELHVANPPPSVMIPVFDQIAEFYNKIHVAFLVYHAEYDKAGGQISKIFDSRNE